MIVRLGFILGFLIGALVASVQGEKDLTEAPGAITPAEMLEDEAEPDGIVDKVKRQARIAAAAARQEAARREAELMLEFEATSNPHRV